MIELCRLFSILWMSYIFYFVPNAWATADNSKLLRLATTTSTENSGLLSVLNRIFEMRHKVKIQVLSSGSGKALRLGENGDVDLLLVHAPNAEREFIANGHGVERVAVMYNDFVLLGPKSDPAGVRKANTILMAFKMIASNDSALFISRGDDSGTHKKEQTLWEKIAYRPSPNNVQYLSVGQGMGASLNIAHNKQAYILSDRGTYIAYRHKLALNILFEGDTLLKNPYHIILVNPAKHPHVNWQLAKKYIAYITGIDAQKMIKDYRIDGEILFYPFAIP